MRKMFNNIREFVFRGAKSRLSVVYRTYMIVLFLTILILIVQNTAFQYSGSKLMLGFYLIVFFVAPLTLAVLTLIKMGLAIKNRRGSR